MGGKNRAKGGPKISKIKLKNIKGKKLGSGKKTKSKDVVKARKQLQRNIRKKLANKGSNPVKEPDAVIEDVLDMISSDDLTHLRKDNFKNSLYLVNNGKVAADSRRNNKRKNRPDPEDDELENDYEDQFMRAKEGLSKEKLLLPIKTRKGLQYITAAVKDEEIVDLNESNLSNEIALEKMSKGVTEEDKVAPEVTTAMLLARRKAKFTEYKVRIGVLSSAFLEDPENRLQNLESLLALMVTSEASVALIVPKLAALSLQAIFKDVLPLYPIKHHNDEGVKLKKDTRQLQGYENNLLRKYKLYMQRLEKLVEKYCPKRRSNMVSEGESKLGRIALTCMCRMLESHPYFNLSVNIVNFITPLLNNWDSEVRNIVIDTIKLIFKIDKRGEISYEIVKRINVFVKSKVKSGTCNIRTDVLDVLLALRIKEVDLEKEKEQESVPGRKMTFEQRKMLSKRQRKKSKELVKLEHELLEASAEENKSRKAHFLTEITKSVFTIYFRALKTTPGSQILSSVLEGLSKFAHVINIDFFDDLLKVLQGLLKEIELPERQYLLCISTVLAVLDGQGSALTLDPTTFHKHLYSSLVNLRCGNRQSNAGLALRCVRLAAARKRMPGPRAVALVKRLATMSLQVEHNDSLAILQQLKQVMRLHSSCSVLLDCEGAGASGIYQPELDDPDHCCGQSSTLWELVPLMSHYHPWVSNASRGMIQPDKADVLHGSLSQLMPEVLTENLDTTSMEFLPKLRAPSGAPKAKKPRGRLDVFKPRTDCFNREIDLSNFQ